jgi:hypothetical protein
MWPNCRTANGIRIPKSWWVFSWAPRKKFLFNFCLLLPSVVTPEWMPSAMKTSNYRIISRKVNEQILKCGQKVNFHMSQKFSRLGCLSCTPLDPPNIPNTPPLKGLFLYDSGSFYRTYLLYSLSSRALMSPSPWMFAIFRNYNLLIWIKAKS